MYNVSITIEYDTYANSEVTVTEDIRYGILHCEHVYYFVISPNSNSINCTSIIDGEQRSVDDQKELNYLLNKFGLDALMHIKTDYSPIYAPVSNNKQKHLVDALMHIKTDYSPIYAPVSNN